MDFWKMHGAGNDFIIIDNRDNRINDKSYWAQQLCDRHFGIGADGFMLVEVSSTCDIKMSFYNSDGTLAGMCGNGIRCFSKYVYDQGICNQKKFLVETGDGPKEIVVVDANVKESTVRVNMGSWNFKDLSLSSYDELCMGKEITCYDHSFQIYCVHMGVPHSVIFTDEIKEENTVRYGSVIEKMPEFPNGTNVNFVKVLDKNKIIVDTWERGAGKTLACGTGVCSSVIIANKLSKTEKEVYVKVAGGDLKITLLPDDTAVMEGKAVTICKGSIVE